MRAPVGRGLAGFFTDRDGFGGCASPPPSPGVATDGFLIRDFFPDGGKEPFTVGWFSAASGRAAATTASTPTLACPATASRTGGVATVLFFLDFDGAIGFVLSGPAGNAVVELALSVGRAAVAGLTATLDLDFDLDLAGAAPATAAFANEGELAVELVAGFLAPGFELYKPKIAKYDKRNGE